MSVANSITESLAKIADERDDEVIDATALKSIVDMVDLEVAAVQICVERRNDRWQFEPPTTVYYEKWDTRWAIVKPQEHDFTILSEDELKRMRARFLLMNIWYYRHWYTLTGTAQRAAEWNFLRHTQGIPPRPDSSAGRMLKIAGGTVAVEGDSQKHIGG